MLRMFVVVLVSAAACASPAVERSQQSWPSASPESRGVDSAGLAQLIEQAHRERWPVHHLQLIIDGAEVARANFYPYDGVEPHDVASITKSVTSTLVGIAIERGLLQSVHQKLLDFFPEREPANNDARKRSIEIEHLLRMSSGFDCGLTPGEPELMAMMATDDWIQYALDLPMHDEPGTLFAYCSPNHYLLSVIVERVAGMPLRDFAEEVLFGPLGIRNAVWPADPDGHTRGWGDLQLEPDDVAKLGDLYLHEGRWRGQQILSRSWVEAAREPVISASDSQDYGYSWWIARNPQGVFMAEGRGGQSIVVWPDRSLLLVVLGGGIELDAITNPLQRLFSDTPRPDNPAAQRTLAKAIAEAKEGPAAQAVPALPSIAHEIDGVRFELDANALGLGPVALSFPRTDEAQIDLTLNGAELGVRVGLDGVPRFSPGPDGLKLASVGQWRDEVFELTIDQVSRINRLAMTLSFQGDTLLLQIEEAATHVFAPQQIEGRAVR